MDVYYTINASIYMIKLDENEVFEGSEYLCHNDEIGYQRGICVGDEDGWKIMVGDQLYYFDDLEVYETSDISVSENEYKIGLRERNILKFS